MNDFNFYQEGLEYFEKVWKIVKKEIPLIGDSNNLQILSMNIHTNHSKMYVLICYDVYKECLYKKGIVHKEDEENLNITYKILPGKDPERVDYEIDRSLALGLNKPKNVTEPFISRDVFKKEIAKFHSIKYKHTTPDKLKKTIDCKVETKDIKIKEIKYIPDFSIVFYVKFDNGEFIRFNYNGNTSFVTMDGYCVVCKKRKIIF